MQKKIKNQFSAQRMLSNIKKLSMLIIKKIQQHIDQVTKFENLIIGKKGQESVITAFLKISSLICKIACIEAKIVPEKEKMNDEMDTELTEKDIHIMKDFLTQHDIKNDKKYDK